MAGVIAKHRAGPGKMIRGYRGLEHLAISRTTERDVHRSVLMLVDRFVSDVWQILHGGTYANVAYKTFVRQQDGSQLLESATKYMPGEGWKTLTFHAS